MDGYIFGQVHKQLWRQVGLYGQMKEKHDGKQGKKYFPVDLCVGTPVDELKVVHLMPKKEERN